MNTRTTLAALCTVGALALTACSSGSDSSTDAKPNPTASASTKASPTPARLTAKQAADKLADATGVTTLGDPADNTSGCASKDAGGCKQLITTDTVSIYEFATPAVAEHWVKTMKAQGDWRQVGRFALAWTARSQDLTSDDRRAELVVALQKLVAAE